MRWVIATALVITLLFGGAASAHQHLACAGWQFEVKHRTPHDVRVRRVKRLIRCVFAEVGIPGESSTAHYVAERESGFAPWAHNTSSDARGLFQHLGSYWPDRARRLPKGEFPRWPSSSAFDGRANAWAAALMVRSGGWGPWSVM